MGQSQHELHTTLICTCRYAALQVFCRHVQMCTLSPPLEYKLPQGRTRVFQLAPPRRLRHRSGEARPARVQGRCLSGEQGAGCAKLPAAEEGVKNSGEQLCHHQDRVITCANGMPKWPLSQSVFRGRSATAGGS